MKPYIVCHMITSLDGRLHPSRYSESPDGTRSDWSALYGELQEALAADAWIVGRVTMAEMTKAGPHAPVGPVTVNRPFHFANRDAKRYGVALDRSGKLHFDGTPIDGGHVVVLLGHAVPDAHLAELMGDGVSYVVAEDDDMNLAALLDVLERELGIRRLLLEGGAAINGAFFAAGLVDELSLLVAPAIDGRSDSPATIVHGEAGLGDKVRLALLSCERLAHGAVHLRYSVHAR